MSDAENGGTRAETRLSRFHPYPAMVADDLAVALAERHVQPGYRVLDPFCGSGRLLLAAASNSGEMVGIDVNPLGCLITMAKSVTASISSISEITNDIERARVKVVASSLDLRDRRKVQWYSDTVLAELSQIVSWVNKLRLKPPEKTVVAAALSAAVRDASYCRKGGWKLHRLAPSARASHSASAWDCLTRRLRYYVAKAPHAPSVRGRVSVVQGDAKEILASGSPNRLPGLFDLVITSPPYGDSKTTVQYGAASSLCLDVVSQIDGFEEFFLPGSDIDRLCLGGRPPRVASPEVIADIKRYWAGSRTGKQAATVATFLADFSQVCENIASSLRPGGRVVLVLGRRSVGGFRLKLDVFAVDSLERLGLRRESCERRLLKEKRLPRRINRFGRAKSEHLRAKGITRTMIDEYILTFEMSRTDGAVKRNQAILPVAPISL